MVKCLEDGADIIILGRSTDTAMFEAPLIYEFGWKLDDWTCIND
ncbi:acyclic terpene utilization AtuA family protein [Megasphaera sp. DJF_B143]